MKKKVRIVLSKIISRLNLDFLQDDIYLKILFFLKMGYRLNLEDPHTFNEKLQWLKINNRNFHQTILVDKYAVKKIIRNKLGNQYVIPTLGVWDNFDEIDFSLIDNNFVLKTTHDSGGVIVCSDKEFFSEESAKKFFEKRIKISYFSKFREWPYKNVKPRIIAEKNMSLDDSGNLKTIIDYKFYCFNGKIDCVMVCVDRESGKPKYYFFNEKWEILPYNNDSKMLTDTIKKPQKMEEMFEIAGILSKGFKHIRIDLYVIDGNIYFGEYTFFSESGFDSNLDIEVDRKWGSLINLGGD